MDWSSFFGAITGGTIGVIIILGMVFAWDEYNRRKETKIEPRKTIRSLEDILESHLEQHIVQHFDTLFPGWRIHTLNIDIDSSAANARPMAIRYRTGAGEIDILCVDSEENFVVIELKRSKAPDIVVAQTDRYIAWVKKTLAEPNQQVKGLIIAKSVDKHLAYTLTQRNNISLWTFDWRVEFDKSPIQKSLQKDSLILDKPGE